MQLSGWPSSRAQAIHIDTHPPTTGRTRPRRDRLCPSRTAPVQAAACRKVFPMVSGGPATGEHSCQEVSKKMQQTCSPHTNRARWHHGLRSSKSPAVCSCVQLRELVAACVHQHLSVEAAEACAVVTTCVLTPHHRYPVHVLESIDPSRPHGITLLGKQLVLWRDAQGQWRCVEDACPHRCATPPSLTPPSPGPQAARHQQPQNANQLRFAPSAACCAQREKTACMSPRLPQLN